MRLIKIGLGVVNTTVGAFRSNTDKLIAQAGYFAEQRCTIVGFGEMMIGGYGSEDLRKWPGYVKGQWEQLLRFAKETSKYSHPTIYHVGFDYCHNGQVYNSIAAVCAGVIVGIVPKQQLPTYGVFREARYFSPGIKDQYEEVAGVPFGDFIYEYPFGKVASGDCEEIWTPMGPMGRRAFSGAELDINSSSSPFRLGAYQTRSELVATRSSDYLTTVAYVNMVGGNDGLVADGGFFINQNGRPIIHSTEDQRFRVCTATCVVDLDQVTAARSDNTTWRRNAAEVLEREGEARCLPLFAQGPQSNLSEYELPRRNGKNFFLPANVETVINPREQAMEEFVQAMVLGTEDYLEKNRLSDGSPVFKQLGNALSGGKDSALTTIILWLVALRKFAGLSYSEQAVAVRNYITCFSMPTVYNEDVTKDIARDLCTELGIGFKEIPIQDAFEREVVAAGSMLKSGESLTRVTRQNIQARIRFARMANWANAVGGFFPQNSNMSEKTVGYFTVFGGDITGNYGIANNLPKTVIEEVLRYLGKKYNLAVIDRLLATKASAELEHNQQDELDLMPFPVLDACLALFVGDRLMPHEVYKVLRQTWTDAELLQMSPKYSTAMLKLWVGKFTALFMANIFKWVMCPLSIHLASIDLERERALELPVVKSNEWLEESLRIMVEEMPD